MRLNLVFFLTCFFIFSCSVEKYNNNVPKKYLDLSNEKKEYILRIKINFGGYTK